ncbi:MAG: methyltransferase domain-containing protein [Candidatus Sumerlaeota bacterium]
MRDAQLLLHQFPKTRTELPEEYRAIYAEHYRRNRAGLSRIAEAWMHRMVAEDVRGGKKDQSTLEIGAGNLNHLQYEPRSAAYDVVEPLEELCLESPRFNRIRKLYGSVTEVSGKEYDRIISIAALEHLCDLPSVVARCGQLLAPNGQLRIAVPSEGTALWTLAWKLTTGLEFRIRHGLNYGVLMRHEHVNTAEEIERILRTFFADVQRKQLGLSPRLSLYQYFECRNYRPLESPVFDCTM